LIWSSAIEPPNRVPAGVVRLNVQVSLVFLYFKFLYLNQEVKFDGFKKSTF